MKKSRLLGAVCATLVGTLLNTAQANIISLDPDAFASGTDISTVFTGVTLSASGGGVTGEVFSLTDSRASTGTRVFGNSSTAGINWGSSPGITFRADFAIPTDFVSIDVIPSDLSDPTTLSVFNSVGTLLTSFRTSGSTGTGIPETASITWGAADIAYMTVFDASNNYKLDDLQFNAVPIPASLWLFGSGLLGLIGIARRKKSGD